MLSFLFHVLHLFLIISKESKFSRIRNCSTDLRTEKVVMDLSVPGLKNFLKQVAGLLEEITRQHSSQEQERG